MDNSGILIKKFHKPTIPIPLNKYVKIEQHREVIRHNADGTKTPLLIIGAIYKNDNGNLRLISLEYEGDSS